MNSTSVPASAAGTKLKKSRIDFILICIRGSDDELAIRINAISTRAEEYGADCEIVGSMVAITCGTLADESGCCPEKMKFIGAVQKDYQLDVKILHGSEVGHSGFLVNQTRVSYNVLLPHFTEARHYLENMDWGETREFKPRL